MASNEVQRYKKRFELLRAEFDQYAPVFRDIRDFVCPYTARFRSEQTGRGERQDNRIINSTPIFAYRALAAGMQSGITSQLRPWMRFQTQDPQMMKIQSVKEWLATVETVLLGMTARSNMYDKFKSSYGTLGAYGTPCVLVEDEGDKGICGYHLSLGTYFLAADQYGDVTTLFHVTNPTVEQMIKKFGIDKVPPKVKTAYDNSDYYTRYEVLHIIEKNELYDPNKLLAQYKLYKSVWIELSSGNGEGSILSRGGYDEKPFFCPRMELNGEDVWGTGCGWTALGDCKQLQLLETRKLEGIDKNADPTMVADPSLQNQRLSNLPGDTVFASSLLGGSKAYSPAYVPNPYINEFAKEIDVVSRRIDEAFFKNLFLAVLELQGQPNITAAQINSMREERLAMLSPVLERVNTEQNDVYIDRIFGIASRRGMLPPPPQELSGAPLKVEYISILAQAQKAIGLGNIERFVGFTQNIAQMWPEVAKKVNAGNVLEQYAFASSVPPDMLRSDEEVQEMIAAEQEAAQQQQEQEQMMQGGMMAAQGVKTLASADMSGDNALTRMMQ